MDEDGAVRCTLGRADSPATTAEVGGVGCCCAARLSGWLAVQSLSGLAPLHFDTQHLTSTTFSPSHYPRTLHSLTFFTSQG